MAVEEDQLGREVRRQTNSEDRMSEENKPEATPLQPGQLTISTTASERKELPNGVYLPCHIESVGVVDFGEGNRLEAQFVVDDGEHKGETFKKWFNPSAAGPKAGIVKLAYGVLGRELGPDFDPTTLVGKPVQVIFQPDTFNGKDIQVATYLPPAPGQTVPKKDIVPTELNSDEVAEFFGPQVSK